MTVNITSLCCKVPFPQQFEENVLKMRTAVFMHVITIPSIVYAAEKLSSLTLAEHAVNIAALK